MRLLHGDVMTEICEWWPEQDRPAEEVPGRPDSRKGCPNETAWSVGVAKNWHLCDSCAALPRFARMRSRKPLPDGGRSPNADAESYCHRCLGPNIVWSAPSPLWNAVMRGGSINGDEEFDGIVCPTCFGELAEQRGIARTWRLTADVVLVELETVTPSGRIWDDGAQLWRSPESHTTDVGKPA